MGLNIDRELTIARGLTRSKRKLSVTPHSFCDRRLVNRYSGADSLDGGNFKWVEAINARNGERYRGELPARPGRTPSRRNAPEPRSGGLGPPPKSEYIGICYAM